MPLSDIAEDFPVHTADILTDTADPDDYDASPTFTKTGEVRVCVLELDGSEAFRLGLSTSTKLRRVFSDLVDGKPPFTNTARLEVRGETLDVLNTKAIDVPGDELCIAECQVM